MKKQNKILLSLVFIFGILVITISKSVSVQELDENLDLYQEIYTLDDNFQYADDMAYAAVYVTPIKSGVWMEVGSKYIHTYDATNITCSVGINIGYSEKGPTGGATFGLQGSTVGKSWSTYADNAVIF